MSGEALRALPLFVSTRSTAQLLGGVLAATAAVCWVAAGYDLGELRLLGALGAGLEIDARERLAHAEAGRMLHFVQVGCVALCASLFLPWLYHVRVNARALGVRRLRFGREWSYLAFLVPGLNLFRPYQVLSEVWRSSDPDTDDPVRWCSRAAPPRLLWWWGLLLAWLGLEALSALLLEHASRPWLGHALSFAGNAGAGVSASLACLIVSRLSRAQEAKWRAWGDSAPPVTTLEAGLSA